MNAFLFAWRASRYLPVSAVRGAAWTVAMYGWATKAKPARRLEDNLARVTGREGRELRRLSRRGLASVARYYAETLELGRMTGEQVDARVRMENFESVREDFERDTGLIAVLSHSGNWDLVGAYACRHIIGVTAVAEVLKPREVFDEFVALREQWGLRILGHEGGATFRDLIRRAKADKTLICLVADRDLSGSGVAVEMWGRGVKVAPGPVALAKAVGQPVVPVMIHYERLRGERRRVGKSRWGVVMTFGRVMHPAEWGDDAVATGSQAWASQFADLIAAHPEDWHMLQRFGWMEAA